MTTQLILIDAAENMYYSSHRKYARQREERINSRYFYGIHQLILASRSNRPGNKLVLFFLFRHGKTGCVDVEETCQTFEIALQGIEKSGPHLVQVDLRGFGRRGFRRIW